ncbi:MAG: MBL fold metallo-hydrolase, partial [Pseudomonadota bacterium]
MSDTVLRPQPAPFDGERFHDPEGQPADKSLLDVAKWMLGSKKTPWPKHRPPAPHAPVQKRVTGEALRVTFVGHATVLIQVAGMNLLTDPFWSDRASPFTFMGPRRVVPPGLPFDAVPPIDAVLLSHNHYDHLDAPTLARLARGHAPTFVAPKANGPYVSPHIGPAPYHELAWGEGVDVGPMRVTALRARHWSRRKAGDMNQALWAAYAIET